MQDGSGWISLHRKIRKHWLWERSDYVRAWLDILMLVNHAPTKVLIKGKIYKVDRGESCRSIKTWAKEFGKKWTRQKVRTFFLLLESDSMINHQTDNRTTMLSVCNYDTYQTRQPAANQQNNQQPTNGQPAPNHQVTTNNKSLITTPNEEEVVDTSPPPPAFDGIYGKIQLRCMLNNDREGWQCLYTESTQLASDLFWKGVSWATTQGKRKPFLSEVDEAIEEILKAERDKAKEATT